MNKQRSIRRSVLLLLTLLFATGCLLCGIMAVSQNFPPKTEQPPQFFHLTENVHIVYPSSTCSDDLQAAVTLLSNAGKDMLGHVLTATDDTAQNEPSSNTLQILLGHTNRPGP